MKCAYFDCFSGISGDMILGAMLDLGLDFEQLKKIISSLPIQGYSLDAQKVMRQNVSGTHLQVLLDNTAQPHRHLSTITEIISKSALSGSVKQKSIEIFKRIAEAEAKVHNTSIEKVHFHEIGAVDTIIDVVGAVAGFEILGIEKIISSPLVVGFGNIKCSHGLLPVPAPATMELLKNCPVKSGDIEGEMVTPTGAAIISTMASSFENMPQISVQKTGYGAGSKDFSPRPNLLRVIVGNCNQSHTDKLTVIEADIDDMNPQLYGWVMEKLFAAKALDVTLTPIIMKKNRPGTRLTVSCAPQLVQTMSEIIFRETTTIGVRYSTYDKIMLSRKNQQIDTQWGAVNIKIVNLSANEFKYTPEYEDCRNIAQREGISIRTVYSEVQRLADDFMRDYKG